MVVILDAWLRAFSKYRFSWGLNLFLFAFPFMYVLRDGVGLAPDSSLFTAVFLLFSMLLFAPTDFSKVYIPDKIASMSSAGFFFIAIFCLFFHYNDADVSQGLELTNFIVDIVFFSMLLFIGKDKLEDNFLRITFILSLIGSFGIIIFAMKNGHELGMRATLSVEIEKTGKTQGVTNPHIFARGAYYGMACIWAMWKFRERHFSKIVMLLALGVHIYTLFITLSMATFLSLLTLFFFWSVANFKRNLINFLDTLFNLRGLIGIVVLAALMTFAFFRYEDKIRRGSELIGGRATRVFNSIISGGKEAKLISAAVSVASKENVTDMSANTRVENFDKVSKTVKDHIEEGRIFPILFGNGYMALYVDSPIIQAFNDLGIFGFLFFLIWNIWVLSVAVREMKSPTSSFRLFMAFIFFIILVGNFSSGVPYGYNVWVYMLFISRFLKGYSKEMYTKKVPTNA